MKIIGILQVFFFQFRIQIMLRTHSVAIRICCSAKIEFEDESLIFSNVFPNIPLLGFHADGEIGWNSLGATEDSGKNLVIRITSLLEYCIFYPEYGETKAKRSKQKYPKVQHQWSTVFVLISWGSMKM